MLLVTGSVSKPVLMSTSTVVGPACEKVTWLEVPAVAAVGQRSAADGQRRRVCRRGERDRECRRDAERSVICVNHEGGPPHSSALNNKGFPAQTCYPCAVRETAPMPQTISTRRCLLLLGAAGLAGGRPVDEVEAELQRMGAVLGVPDVQCAATPTGLFVSLGSDEAAGFQGVGAPLRFDQSAAVSRIVDRVLAGDLDADGAVEELRSVLAAPPLRAALGRGRRARAGHRRHRADPPARRRQPPGRRAVRRARRAADRARLALAAGQHAAAGRRGVQRRLRDLPGRRGGPPRRVRCGRCCRRWPCCCRAR